MERRIRRSIAGDIADILLEPLRRARELLPPPPEPLTRFEEEVIERSERIFGRTSELEMKQRVLPESLPPASDVEYWSKFWADISRYAVPGYEYLRSGEIWKYLKRG